MNKEKIEIVYVDIKELKPNPKNPRRISRAEFNKLIRSIKEYGFKDPVIVNKRKDRVNVIIGGHMRVEAAKKLNMTKVPVVYVDLPRDKESMFNIALNEISGEWDEEKLFMMLKELNDRGADLTLTGFDEPFIDEIMEANKAQEREGLIDIAPPTPEKPKSKIGEVYQLGKHRLMCGDATNQEHFKQLMGKVKADACWMDPPYGVSYKGTNNPNGRDWGIMTNDELRGDDLYKLLYGIFNNVAKHTKENPALYTCYASINHRIFEKALIEAGFKIKQQLIWEKGHVLGHSDYHWSHEPLLYCRKKDHNSEWLGDRTHKTVILNGTIEQLEELKKEELIGIISDIRKNSDLIKVRKDPSIEYLHSTQKPVELSRQMIKNNTRPTEKVLDPCGGSGSTLIACESSNRACYCMEIEPKYCDVILDRWVAYTDKEPVRISDKKPWSQIKKRKVK